MNHSRSEMEILDFLSIFIKLKRVVFNSALVIFLFVNVVYFSKIWFHANNSQNTESVLFSSNIEKDNLCKAFLARPISFSKLSLVDLTLNSFSKYNLGNSTDLKLTVKENNCLAIESKDRTKIEKYIALNNFFLTELKNLTLLIEKYDFIDSDAFHTEPRLAVSITEIKPLFDYYLLLNRKKMSASQKAEFTNDFNRVKEFLGIFDENDWLIKKNSSFLLSEIFLKQLELAPNQDSAITMTTQKVVTQLTLSLFTKFIIASFIFSCVCGLIIAYFFDFFSRAKKQLERNQNDVN